MVFKYNRSTVNHVLIGTILCGIVLSRNVYLSRGISETVPYICLIVYFMVRWSIMVRTPYIVIHGETMSIRNIYTLSKRYITIGAINKIESDNRFSIFNNNKIILYLLNGSKRKIYIRYLENSNYKSLLDILNKLQLN